MEPENNKENDMNTRSLASNEAIDKAVDQVLGGEAIQIAPGAIEQHSRAEVDVQIVTAQRFKRSIRRFMDDLQTLVCMNAMVSQSFTYVIPRDGKMITGPSARFSEAVAASWGHLRIASMIVGTDDKFVTVRGMAWDLQRNVAFSCEVRRRITKSNGERYGDDMIVTTTNAATSIALRNAVLKVVPAALWRPVWEESRIVAAKDGRSTEESRAIALQTFKKMGVDEPRVLAMLGVKGHEDIDIECLSTLRGVLVAIKEGATTVEEAFPSNERAQRASKAHATLIQSAPQQEPSKPAPAQASRNEPDDGHDHLGEDIPF